MPATDENLSLCFSPASPLSGCQWSRRRLNVAIVCGARSCAREHQALELYVAAAVTITCVEFFK